MVSIFVGVTDGDWFSFLTGQQPDEVNFWSPSPRGFQSLVPGELFLFKLHAPLNFIVGGGVYSHSSVVPLSLAWEAFDIKNGAPTLAEMRSRILRYRRFDDAFSRDPQIGCRILTSPFFWPRERWLPAPATWASQTVRGKRYDTDEFEGQRLWQAVVERQGSSETEPTPTASRFGKPALVRPRLGQGAFRFLVTDAYERRCAVSGEKTLPILDAAHIKSYADGGAHEGSNGLLLRTDIHKLFDLGYVTVDADRRFVVSRRLKEDFDNGRHYYDLHGSTIRTPRMKEASPSSESLDWHRSSKFLG